jgi:hypothetical protein
LQGLIQRGFDVTIFHRGTHEPDGLPEVRHVHGDPHFEESIISSIGEATFDVVLAAYGRTKVLAEVLRGRTGRFLSIGGPPRYAGFFRETATSQVGVALPLREGAPLVGPPEDGNAPGRFSRRMVETESAVFDAHPGATVLIYPVVYGPRNVVPWEWSVVKRVLDGRKAMVLPDDGLALHSRGAAQNLAQFVLLAVDAPQAAAGQVYNCADDEQHSVRQFAQLILSAMGAEIDLVGVPSVVAPLFRAIHVPTPATTAAHTLMDTGKARTELGYADVITPADAIRESVEWYLAHPVDLSSVPPTFVDRFDYALEDDVIKRWHVALENLQSTIPQDVPDMPHPMPHPRSANQRTDERGR